eukprot:m.161891 g.161891  ORF g.161891 m.161891 type:complete len:497 (+) comp14367_c6_seq3:790-2280(+)
MDTSVSDVLAEASQSAEPELLIRPSPDFFTDSKGLLSDKTITEVFIGAEIQCSHFSHPNQVTRHLHAGTFGRGWEVKSTSDGTTTFLKTLRCPGDLSRGELDGTKVRNVQYDYAVREIEFYSNNDLGSHPNIVHTEVCLADVHVPSNGFQGQMYLFHSELCGGGALYNFLTTRTGSFANFSEGMAHTIFRQLVDGMVYLHEIPVYHRDLKLENVMVADDYTIKIADFGSATTGAACQLVTDDVGNLHHAAQTIVGTLQPPELVEGALYDPASYDVWSLGAILLFLLDIEEVNGSGVDFNILQHIASGSPEYRRLLDMVPAGTVPVNSGFWRKLPVLDQIAPSDSPLRHLFNSMFNKNFTRRITMNEIAGHEWLQQEPVPAEQYIAEMEARAKDYCNLAEKKLPIDMDMLEPDELIDILTQAATDAIHLMGATTQVMWHDEVQSVVVGDPALVAIQLDEAVTAHWLSCPLNDWLTFTRALLEALGAQGCLMQEQDED